MTVEVATVVGAIAGTGIVQFFTTLRAFMKSRDKHTQILAKLDQVIEEQASAREERRSQRTLTTELQLHIVKLQEKYAELTVGSTVVPESTGEREELQRKATEKVTGRFPAPKPGKKGSS